MRTEAEAESAKKKLKKNQEKTKAEKEISFSNASQCRHVAECNIHEVVTCISPLRLL